MMILLYISYSNITTIVVVCDTDGLFNMHDTSCSVDKLDCVPMTENSRPTVYRPQLN